MNESALTREVIKLLNNVPLLYAVKIHGGPHQRKGLPDITGCVEGAFFGIEMKLEGNRPTPLQLAVLAKIRACGGLTGVVTVPPTREGVRKAFKQILEILGVEDAGD